MHTVELPAHSQTAAAIPPHGFVRLPTILRLIPVGRSTLWEMIARGDFPPPVKLSARVSAWRSHDVHAFMASRTTAHRVGNVKSLVRAASVAAGPHV